MKIRDAILAEALPLPPIPNNLAYQYVIAGNGLFIRAEDSRMEAMVPVALAAVHGLESVETYARLKVPRVPGKWLRAILQSARRRLPNEAMYQLTFDGSIDEAGNLDDEGWHCLMPTQITSAGSASFDDNAAAVIDLHSHGKLSAFFSETDDGDEQGLRFYAVIGRIDNDPPLGLNMPQIAVRVGVYGHTWNVPVETIFCGLGIFAQIDPEVELVLAETEDEDEPIN